MVEKTSANERGMNFVLFDRLPLERVDRRELRIKPRRIER
jgi:hypothetical protein